jgi:hypothetical protein
MRNITEITRRQPPLLIPARLKVCAYVRVSTDHREQIGNFTSLKALADAPLTVFAH